MKSRNLLTVHDLIISNYTISSNPLPNSKYLHSFTTATTGKLYEFESSSVPMLVNGDRYSVGFEVINGRNCVDVYSLGKAGSFDKDLSYLVAQHYSANIFTENIGKNASRVSHASNNGVYYWGRKYAWRRYGLVISKSAFYAYLDEIQHPFVACITSNPDLGPMGNQNSTAYADPGIEAAIDDLIQNAVPTKSGRYFRSPCYSRQFQIRAPGAITDKK